jgi:hypothetical protein
MMSFRRNEVTEKYLNDLIKEISPCGRNDKRRLQAGAGLKIFFGA